MAEPENEKTAIQQAAEDLFNFAIDREDVKWLMSRLPQETEIKRNVVEYELPILKIISVGWSIAYFLFDSSQKDELIAGYWESVREFSQALSSTTELWIGQNIDYFQILKDRLAMYVDALNRHPEATEPAQIIAPEFARTCGNVDDIFAFMTGSKMFTSTVGKVKEYLEAVKLR